MNKREVSPMYDLIERLCKENGTSPTKLCTEITGSRGNLPTWQKGNINPISLVKIADYFHISVDYLLGRTENTSNIIHTGDITGDNNITGNSGDVTIGAKMSGAEETAREINTILSVLTPRQRTELMMMIYQFADEHTVQKSA